MRDPFLVCLLTYRTGRTRVLVWREAVKEIPTNKKVSAIASGFGHTLISDSGSAFEAGSYERDARAAL